MEATLLVELLTEELPPKSLRMLGDAFADQLVAEIVKYRLKDRVPGKQTFATPRRLAVLVPEVRENALESSHSVEGPASSNTKAVEGFARKYKVTPESLERFKTEKGEIVVARFTLLGVHLDAVLSKIVEGILKKLPVPKMMRWGAGEAQFVRPVHGLVMMHGSRVMPGEVLGLKSTNQTRGHRFLSAGPITLKHANDYERALREDGKVISSFEGRRSEIVKKLSKIAGDGADLVTDDALLDEITALVEAPTVYAGEFSPDYLAVPQECLILSMQQHQKYVPLCDKAGGKLLPRFLFVSNLNADDPSNIIRGNERVLRARLSDAKFFYEQDRKTRLEARVPRLADVVYHNKLGSLGSQLQRVERIRSLAEKIAAGIGADPRLAKRAAHLSKADLLTDMVGEFPELQGVMGRYYSLNDGETREVADAIEQHYRPRFAGDLLPEQDVAVALALADKLETLVGMFGIGQQPTGDKDPFALRRHALGVIRLLVEKRLKLDVTDLLRDTAFTFDATTIAGNTEKLVYEFLKARLEQNLCDNGYSVGEARSVVSGHDYFTDFIRKRFDDAFLRAEAARSFVRLPEALDLIQADKRCVNILKKRTGIWSNVDPALFKQPEETGLFAALRHAEERVPELASEERYVDALVELSLLRTPVGSFFDKVLVDNPDTAIRLNRTGLLTRLSRVMNQVITVSKLAS